MSAVCTQVLQGTGGSHIFTAQPMRIHRLRRAFSGWPGVRPKEFSMFRSMVENSTSPARRCRVTSVLAMAALLSWVPAHAQEGGRGMRMARPAGGMMLFNGPPEHISRAVDHLLDGLGATDAQRVQVKQIAQGAAVDLKAQRDTGRSLRDKGMQAFAAPTVDAAAAESVRQQMIAQQDQASQRVLAAMLDIGKVLTPDQRARIGERMKQRQAMMQERMQRADRMNSEHGERPKP